MAKGCCYDGRKAHHSQDLKKKLINRLNRISGQIRGIQRMVEEDVYCDDVLTQIAAVKSALSGLANQLFEAHLSSCIYEQIQSGSHEIMDELKQTINRMVNNK